MGPRAHSGEKVPPGSQKGAEGHFPKLILGVILETCGHHLGCHFLMLFVEASFSLLG